VLPAEVACVYPLLVLLGRPLDLPLLKIKHVQVPTYERVRTVSNSAGPGLGNWVKELDVSLSGIITIQKRQAH
jgi:hypothetical protein